jgi:glycosyltransferase involved in cell wall biosynthesis
MKILLLARSTLYTQPGGDTVQIVETAKALNETHFSADIHLKGESIPFMNYDLVHFFNLGRPADILPYLPQIRVPIVVSTIFVEYDKGRFQYLIEYAKTIGRWINGSDSYPGWLYIQMRHKKAIQLVLDRAKFLITTTPKEAQRLKENWVLEKTPRTISLGLNEQYLKKFKSIDRSGALVVGRLESLKNQKAAILAANDLKLPLKVIGNAARNQANYAEECKKIANENVSFLPFMETEDLILEYRKAELLILPSQFETFGLVALEAWSQGCKLVLSKNIESDEFFADKAVFFDPNDKEGLLKAIETAKNTTPKPPSKSELESLSWSTIVNEVVRIYEAC